MQNNSLYPRINFEQPSAVPISDMLRRIMSYEEKIDIYRLNLAPSYQRGEAWEKEFKDKLIYSLIAPYPIGNFIVRKLDPKSIDEPTHEVVDGQQRLRAIREFVEKGMELSPANSRIIMKENLNYYEYDIKNNGLCKEAKKIYDSYMKNPEKANIKLTFAALPSLLQRRINGHNLTVVHVECDDDSIRQYFRFIQNQERLRAGEIINAIPDSPASIYLNKINNKDQFLTVMGWHESRKEFDKIFYSMLGIFDNKLLYGTTDKEIINYITDFKELSDSAKICIENLIAAINAISNLTPNRIIFNKRLLKFLFLLSGYKKVNFTRDTLKNFNALVSLNDKIVTFNSQPMNKIKEFFKDYSDDEIEQFREMFLFGRGSHAKSVVERRLNIMATLINKIIEKG